eukprot:m.107201 g.107201  ORF g.107201 m.107201 type:complete len:114 (-) comp9173_c0_seq3:47-388(-)
MGVDRYSTTPPSRSSTDPSTTNTRCLPNVSIRIERNSDHTFSAGRFSYHVDYSILRINIFSYMDNHLSLSRKSGKGFPRLLQFCYNIYELFTITNNNLNAMSERTDTIANYHA